MPTTFKHPRPLARLLPIKNTRQQCQQYQQRPRARQQKKRILRGRGVGPGAQSLAVTKGLQKLFIFLEICYHSKMFDNFESFPYEVRKLEATEARLQRIYDAAKLGLKGDTLALAAGMLPTEYRQLTQLDPIAEMAELKGKADGEYTASKQLHQAAADGDAKAALAILQNVHGWVAKQQLSIDVEQRISITQALEQAQSRVIEGVFKQVDDQEAFHVKHQLKEKVA